MKEILLLDTSIASGNKGDDIIMECTRKELAPILRGNFVRTLPTHVSAFHWYQVLRNSSAIQHFANASLKFVGGSNILVPNLLTHYPQWNINLWNYQPLKGCILVGVGAGTGAESGSNWYTRYLYRHLLNKDYYHSMRDERSRQYVERLGLKALNTGCVTMWMFTPDFCRQIPTRKSNRVVFTLTAGKQECELDQYIIDTLVKLYQEVYFWPQGLGDYAYFQKMKNIKSVQVLEATKEAYDDFLSNSDTDYVGTRLHGGIYAMRHKRRAIIIAIDERARAIHQSNHLNCLDESNIKELGAYIEKDFQTDIQMNFEAIQMWKRQFLEI